jgi:hypothetical protein
MEGVPVSLSPLPFVRCAGAGRFTALESRLDALGRGLAGFPKLLCVVSKRVCSGYVNPSGFLD